MAIECYARVGVESGLLPLVFFHFSSPKEENRALRQRVWRGVGWGAARAPGSMAGPSIWETTLAFGLARNHRWNLQVEEPQEWQGKRQGTSQTSGRQCCRKPHPSQWIISVSPSLTPVLLPSALEKQTRWQREIVFSINLLRLAGLFHVRRLFFLTNSKTAVS